VNTITLHNPHPFVTGETWLRLCAQNLIDAFAPGENHIPNDVRLWFDRVRQFNERMFRRKEKWECIQGGGEFAYALEDGITNFLGKPGEFLRAPALAEEPS
jgi:hypothetical protein